MDRPMRLDQQKVKRNTNRQTNTTKQTNQAKAPTKKKTIKQSNEGVKENFKSIQENTKQNKLKPAVGITQLVHSDDAVQHPWGRVSI